MPFSEYVESLYDESERRESFGTCPRCEDEDGGEETVMPITLGFFSHSPNEERVLCYICGVCFKYHHDEYSCEMLVELPDEAYMEPAGA